MSKKQKKHKGGEPELSVLRDVKEAAAVQQARSARGPTSVFHTARRKTV